MGNIRLPHAVINWLENLMKISNKDVQCISAFADKEYQPLESDLESVLGACLPLWQNLLVFITESYQMSPELNYGGRKYGWNLWYRKSGKSLVSLYPKVDHFIAQIVLGREQVEKAEQTDFGESVQILFDQTPSLHDGRWLFIPVHTRQDLQDVYALLLIKKRPLKR